MSSRISRAVRNGTAEKTEVHGDSPPSAEICPKNLTRQTYLTSATERIIDIKKIVAGILAVLLAGGSFYGYTAYKKTAISSSAEEIAKEVTEERGNVTAGVTESAAISVEPLEQTYDLVLTSTSLSASVESGSGGSPAGGSGGGMSMGGMSSMSGGMSGGKGGIGSTSVSSQSESSSVELVVDEVLITEGQSVNKGDVIMTITQESIDEARTKLTEAVNDAELALKQAQIEESETKLSAQFDYDTRISEGNNAEAVYNAAMEEIAQNIDDLYEQLNDANNDYANCTDDKQLSQLATQISSLKAQIKSAESSRASDELAAKQAYDEAVMYFENAQDLYDVSVNDVGSAAEEAQQAVDDAKADLAAFEELYRRR